jgi:hypothetical protein
MMTESSAEAIKARAARLRRLWRGNDMNHRASGLALGRPMLTPAEPRILKRPAHGITARELIGMARAARAEGASATSPQGQSGNDSIRGERGR